MDALRPIPKKQISLKAYSSGKSKFTSSTILAIGGNYTNTKEQRVENAIPFAFFYDISGPEGKR